jgi:acyl-CoA synthetase (NDP forming)
VTVDLAEFFAPRGIAMVGASDNSGWARFIVSSCATAGFSGPLIPVHPRAKTAFGLPVAPSLRELPAPVDLAFILAPVPAVPGVLDDMAAAGVRHAVVLAAGYREVGPDGRKLEATLTDRARDHGITLLGPNCLGFLNAHTGAAPFALLIPPPLLPGPVGIGLQSGALATVVLAFARAHAIGISLLATLGNEAMIDSADVLAYLAQDDATRVICLFLEEIGDPARFAAAAAAAGRAGKPVVVLKAGASPAGQQSALAHTGSVAGDDAVVSAALRAMNVIRVNSLEELLATGQLLGYGAAPRGRRMGVLTLSGGACDLIADAASAAGLEIPPFADATTTAIAPHLPSFGAVRNPLDATGFGTLANISARTEALTPVDHALDAAVTDPGLDFVLFTGLALPDARPPDQTMADMLEARVTWLGQRVADSPIPVIPAASTCVNLSDYARDLLTAAGFRLLPGLDLAVRAAAHAARWSAGRGRPQGIRGAHNPTGGHSCGPHARPRAWSEAAGRRLLAGNGIPVVPGGLATSADAAVEIARGLEPPLVVKICSARITHKSEVGGVVLGVQSPEEVRAAYEKVLAADELADGVLVTTMRSGGVELLAGVTVDPVFGPVLAVGLGGVWVEVLGDTSLRLLPVTPDEVKRMLGELRGLPLLRGARGTVAADLDVLAGVIAQIGDVAVSVGGVVEVNPLWVCGDQVEALDVLVVAN